MGSILLAGFDASTAERVRAQLAGDAPGSTPEGLDVSTVDGADEVLERLADGPVSVLCLGGGVAGEEAARLLRRTAATPDPPVALVLAAGADPDRFQDLVAEDRLFYLCHRPPPPADVAALVRGALARSRRRPDAALDPEHADVTRRILTLAQQLAGEKRPERVARQVARAAEHLAEARRGECLLVDPASETLWGPPLEGGDENGDGDDGGERRESAAVGAASFVARAAVPLVLERLGDDPRHDPGLDNPGGEAGDRFLAVPVPSARRGVLAVLKVLRRADEAPFGDAELAVLRALAVQVAPVLDRLALQGELELAIARRSDGGEPLFRREALEHHTRGVETRGHLLHVSPAWMPWAYRVLVLVFAGALLYGIFGTVRELATVPAVVRVLGDHDVTAPLAGTVTAIETRAGQRVAAGQVLARLHDAHDAAELARLELELARLAAADAPPTGLEAERRLLLERLERRVVRAPHAGVVAEVRCRVGEPVTAGRTLVTMSHEHPARTVVVLLPGHLRPRLHAGMPLRLGLRGYPDLDRRLSLDRLGDQVLGPAEARRALGAVGDAVPVAGPVVLAWADLPRDAFDHDPAAAPSDGVVGTAEVQLGTEPILVTLFPGLKGIFG